MSNQKTGAQILVEGLIREGVEVVFGIPGGAVLPLYDALYDAPIRHILCRHEQGAAHAADAYARVTGRVGVCIVTSGPGATNAVTGIANAYMDSVPLVVITGQVASPLIGGDAFQEADTVGITMPVTKHNYLLRDVADLARIVREAFHIAATGRPGPVLIDLPRDVTQQTTEPRFPRAVHLPGYKPNLEGHPMQIQRAAKLLSEAERPFIYAGGGVNNPEAAAGLRELAERGGIPVGLTLTGLGAFPGDHPLCTGMLGMHGTKTANLAVSEADVIFAVGVRFDDRVTGMVERFARQARIIHLDVDPAEIGKNVPVAVPIVGDVRRVLPELLAKFKPANTAAWQATVAAWQREYPLTYRQSGAQIMPQAVIQELFRQTKGEAVICTDVGQHQMWAAQYYPVREPRTFVTSGGLGTMGFGLPAALGAQVGRPDKLVVQVAGDGSLQMTLQELATLVQERLPVKIVVINNGYLGMVRQWQEMFYRHRYSSVDLQAVQALAQAAGAEAQSATPPQNTSVPDFVRLAGAYGIPAWRAKRPEELAPTLARALQAPGPALVDCWVTPEENVYPMVPPGRPLEEIILGA